MFEPNYFFFLEQHNSVSGQNYDNLKLNYNHHADEIF